MVHDYSRSHFPRQPQWPAADPMQEGGNRFLDANGVRRPPMTVEKALREQCNIPAKSYFVAAILDDGQTCYFTGPDSIPFGDVPKFFNQQAYVRYLRSQGSVSTPIHEESWPPFDDFQRPSAGPQYPSRRGSDRRPAKSDYDHDPYPTYHMKARKRLRSSMTRRDFDDNDTPVPITSSKKALRIGDTQEVWNFYDQRFRNCQQTACKLIAKAWVKAVEPKKQSNHPYTGSDEKAPDWWPKPWGTTRDEKVRHKEPDHLYKKERVHLLNHILRMVVEPNATQHPDIQKLYLDVKKLEEVTNEALSSFFADKDNTNNAKKRPYLKEIFKVALQEEKYKNGEIDPNAIIYVMADDKCPDSYQSENEDGGAKDDDNAPSSVSSGVSPLRTTNPSHGLIATTPSSSTQSPAGPLQGGPFVSDLPVRPAQYAPSMLPSDLGTDQHGYVEGGGMGVGGPSTLQPHGNMPMPEILPQHDAGRRPSLHVYNSPPEYSNPPSAGLYNPNTWQTATAAPSGPPMYASNFPTQQQQQQHQQHPLPPPQGAYVTQQQPLPPGQPYLGGSFDGIPRYDSGPGSLYRPGAVQHVQHNPVPPTQGYEYLGHDSRALPGTQLKLDSLGRNALH